MIVAAADKQIFSGNEDRLEQLRLLVVLLYVFSMPFDIFYSSLIFIVLGVLTLFDLSKTKFRQIPSKFWIFQAVFFIALAGHFYSLHKNVSGFLMERQLTILLFPLILPLAIKITAQKLDLALRVLLLSCSLAIVYLFIYMVYTIRIELHLQLVQTISSGTFFNHQFSHPIRIHAGYFSLYCALSIIYAAYRLWRQPSRPARISYTLTFIILFLGLIFLAARNTIITTFIILAFILPLFNLKHKQRYILISLGYIVIAAVLVFSVPYLRTRFSEELISDIRSKNGSLLVPEPRVERWACAWNLIERSPVIGYGTGDEVEMLKTEYIRKGFFISYVQNFNAHNVYLSMLIKNGIIGLIAFLLVFYYYCQLAIRNRDFMYLSFLILLLIGFYTENILDANKGIVFFSLFNTFMGYSLLSRDRAADVPKAQNT